MVSILWSFDAASAQMYNNRTIKIDGFAKVEGRGEFLFLIVIFADLYAIFVAYICAPRIVN